MWLVSIRQIIVNLSETQTARVLLLLLTLLLLLHQLLLLQISAGHCGARSGPSLRIRCWLCQLLLLAVVVARGALALLQLLTCILAQLLILGSCFSIMLYHNFKYCLLQLRVTPRDINLTNMDMISLSPALFTTVTNGTLHKP